MGFFENVLTKEQAAKTLGVSRATFDRLRKRLGIQPIKTVLAKPVFFDRLQIQTLGNGAAMAKPEPVRTSKTILERTKLVSLPKLKAAGKAARKAGAK